MGRFSPSLGTNLIGGVVFMAVVEWSDLGVDASSGAKSECLTGGVS